MESLYSLEMEALIATVLAEALESEEVKWSEKASLIRAWLTGRAEEAVDPGSSDAQRGRNRLANTLDRLKPPDPA